MRTLITTTNGDPLLAAGRINARGVALLTFALGDSDLPLQVAFPLLVSNLTDFLLPPTDGVLPPSVELGAPLAVQIDPTITRVSLVDTATDGAAVRLELDVLGGSLTLPPATSIGIRELRTVSENAELDGQLIGQTAANLFDPGESAVAPRDPRRIADLGRVGPANEANDLSARNEWWWPLALAALLLLLAEWMLFHRPTRRAIRRLVQRRPRAGGSAQRRPSGAGT